MSRIPKGWLQYEPFGTVIEGTKILPFKVPLRERTVQFLHQDQQFTPSILKQEFPHLKYIIDLTNTTIYYNSQDFVNCGIRYEKIWIPGMTTPAEDLVRRFLQLMDDFHSTCGKDDIIGVHCTHGVNRTGYLICRYLMKELGWTPIKSMEEFAKARGYNISRQHYIKDLEDRASKTA